MLKNSFTMIVMVFSKASYPSVLRTSPPNCDEKKSENGFQVFIIVFGGGWVGVI